jgi:DNA-binding LacI/PurR family transcriptional regulator
MINVNATPSLIEQVREHFIQRIASGELAPGQRINSVRKLAQEAGVSHATAAAALRSLVADGWIVSRVGKGSFVAPEPPARTLPTRNTKAAPRRRLTEAPTGRIHFFFCYAEAADTSSYHTQVLCSLQDAAEARGWQVKLSMLQNREDLKKAVVDPEAIGLVVAMPREDDSLEELLGAQVPIVQYGMHPERDDISYVMPDNLLGARLATLHLLEQGHRNILFVTALIQDTPKGGAGHAQLHFAIRHQGYREVMTRAGLAVPPSLTWSIYSPDSHQHLRKIFASVKARDPQTPSALLVGNDMMAAEIMQLAAQAGIRIPEDLSIIGFENRFHSAQNQPALSTIGFHCDAMGRELISVLEKIRADRTLNPLKVILPMQLIARDTVGPWLPA